MGTGGRDAFRPRCVCSCIHSFAYGNAATRTFGRAHRHRPYAFCLRELLVDVHPYDFVWADYAWMVGGVWVDYPWEVDFVGEDCARMYNGDGRDESPRRKSGHVCLLHQTHGFGLFHEQGHERFALVGHLIVEHGILQGLF